MQLCLNDPSLIYDMIGMKMTTFSNRLKNTDREGNYIYIYLEIKDNARNKPQKKKKIVIFLQFGTAILSHA